MEETDRAHTKRESRRPWAASDAGESRGEELGHQGTFREAQSHLPQGRDRVRSASSQQGRPSTTGPGGVGGKT